MDLSGYYDFRNGLVKDVVADLIGPSDEHEIINDKPSKRYISGILYPQRSGTIALEDQIETTDSESKYTHDDEGPAADPPVAMANVRYPSSMGLTFAVDSKATRKIKVSISASKYIPIETKEEEAVDENVDDETDIIPGMVEGEKWQRVPLPNKEIEIDIGIPDSGYKGLSPESLKLFVRVRDSNSSGIVPVTIVLVNKNESASDAYRYDDKAIFQPKLTLTSAEPTKGVFFSRTIKTSIKNDEDLKSYRLLYRHVSKFATGHGCSVGWEEDKKHPNRAKTIFTTYSPEYNLLLTDSNYEIKSEALGIKWLVNTPRATVIEALTGFCDGYGDWIKSCYSEAENLRAIEEEFHDTAIKHLQSCEEALGRMRRGVEMLAKGEEDDNHEWMAFRFMNKAMLQQMIRRDKPEGGPEKISEHHWRPFQLAFILLCLVGVSNKESDDRDLLDLLWFPTGGGKTEAYLGLISYAIFLRRLKHTNGAGVTAFMRYTMRLLTIQQFQRAALLICCCEVIRKNNPKLGQDSITVGLWVGKAATPNTRNNARSALKKLLTRELETENPIQLHKCPWCRHPLTHKNYIIEKNPDKMVVKCNDKECEFSKGLPIYLIDEDIYDYKPTLIIATVDKFAHLPWDERALEIFNYVKGNESEYLPPELIIQDELHLISGPLGTLTGLYETAVDKLCARKGPVPKIIASTATIRRAEQQVRGLYNRKVRQFPPPALDIRNSYFAVELPEEKKGSRLYIGLNAPSMSHATLLIRCFAALFQKGTITSLYK